MPDWLSPFHLPTFTDAEFKEMRRKYVAKYGYRITLPDFDDIIITHMFQPMTPEEIKYWKARDYDKIPFVRREKIFKQKQRKKKRFLAMLASPTPDIIHNIGSIMTALDDCQDALITCAFLGRVAIKLVPGLIGKALMGPVGWLMTAADLLNVATVATQLVRPGTTGKRTIDLISDKNPLGAKAKALRTRKLLQYMPDSADAIQALQVSASVFGFGICLGPLIGLAEDLIAGFVRYFMGQPVEFDYPKHGIIDMVTDMCRVLCSAGYYMGVAYETDEEAFTEVMLAAHVANQGIVPFLKEWHPLDNVKNIQDLHFMAPIPKNILTIEIIEEEGLDVLTTCGWPHNKQMWTRLGEYWEYGQDVAKNNLTHMMELNRDNRRGQMIAYLGKEIAFQSLTNLVGEGNVVYDYTTATKAVNTMLYHGYSLSPDITPDKLKLLEDWLNELESINDSPTFKELSRYCQNNSIPLVAIQ